MANLQAHRIDIAEQSQRSNSSINVNRLQLAKKKLVLIDAYSRLVFDKTATSCLPAIYFPLLFLSALYMGYLLIGTLRQINKTAKTFRCTTKCFDKNNFFFIKIDVICVRFDKILIEPVEIGGVLSKTKVWLKKKLNLKKWSLNVVLLSHGKYCRKTFIQSIFVILSKFKLTQGMSYVVCRCLSSFYTFQSAFMSPEWQNYCFYYVLAWLLDRKW